MEVKRADLNRFESPRLLIEELRVSDFAFLNELLNTEGFLKYIGDRNIRSDGQAKDYIFKTLKKDSTQYWVAKLKPELEPAGLVSFVKRDFLPYRDIGFAFLPRHMGRGYAYEAVRATLIRIPVEHDKEMVLAITDKCNKSSIRLLEKLKFEYQKEVDNDGEILSVYGIDTAKLAGLVQNSVVPHLKTEGNSGL